MQGMEDLEPWLILRSIKGLSDGTLARLVRGLGSPEAVLHASVAKLQHTAGITHSLASAIHLGPDYHQRKETRKELDYLHSLPFSAVTLLDPQYPQRLAMIPDPPAILFVSGSLTPHDEFGVAIVGARRASQAGLAFTEELSSNLTTLGFTIISGLARGIDAASHQGALKASGRTLAVLGCGLDRTYPPEHRKLRRQIESQGAILSEFSLGAPPLPYHFPRRNRIISGLSLGVVVTEANLKSGSLITARLALDYNREVFAVPGSVKDSRHHGPHALIKQGAKLVESSEDILEELLPQLDESFQDRVSKARPAEVLEPPAMSTPEREVYDLIGEEPITIDEILSQAPFLPAEVLSILLGLEIKGLIRQGPGACYVRI